MRRLLAIAAATVLTLHADDDAQASTADTQARLAAARPVATEAVTPPLSPHRPPPRHEPMAAPPKPDPPTPNAPASRPAPSRGRDSDIGLIPLLPALLMLVAVMRWFARRRRSAPKRV